ncbi:TPA: hypothetical protein ACUKGQ_004656 [Escherichia coli]|nr:hypothetical protein [Escherichia coli]
MKFIVKALICFAALCVTTAYAFDNKEFSRGEIKYSDYLPGNGWTLPEGYTQERFISSIYKSHKLNDFPWTMTFQVRGRGVVFMANKIYKTWHVLPLDYENLNFGSILTDIPYVR